MEKLLFISSYWIILDLDPGGHPKEGVLKPLVPWSLGGRRVLNGNSTMASMVGVVVTDCIFT